MRKLRAAEVVAGAGAVVLLASLPMAWFDADAGSLMATALDTTGWAALGWAMVAALVLCALLALGLCLAIVAGRSDAPGLVVGIALVVVAVPTLMALIIVLLARPGLGVGLPRSAVGLEPAAWLGVVAMAAIAAGSIASLHNERTAGADRRCTPPAPRPAP
jgi:hypothetical protein